MKTTTNIFLALLFISIILFGCGEDKKLSGEHYFFLFSKGKVTNFQKTCAMECDGCWVIEFQNETSAKIWSTPCSSSTGVKSCSSNVDYIFDQATKTIKILSITNDNVSDQCKNEFLGEWQWSDGKKGKNFYSKSSPDFYISYPDFE